MTQAREFATHVVDLLEPFGHCEARRMFGGYGIFHQDLMLALIADGNLYLKADDASRGHFEAAGCEAFVYYRQDKPYRLSYYLAPEVFFDDDGERVELARLAFEAALRGPRRKGKSAR